eukprot:TRINITY_DN7732_c0_g1_i1.p1 TRINITY_DN7732_c0_g1~~TRINITY_DN7732_c0_g1_i1.p1  ORF type:complete len:204 (+),score=39.48 TRINITY_DN7732_c0_g1_i1:76-687(+)
MANIPIMKGLARLCVLTADVVEECSVQHRQEAEITAAHQHNKSKHFIQGYFVDTKSKSTFGIMAHEIEQKDRIPDCCFQKDDPQIWFSLTLIDFPTQREFNVEVEKSGADFVQLRSSNVTFSTSTLHSDQDAKDLINKFFPKIAALEYDDAIVCTGEMTLENIKFQDPKSASRVSREKKVSEGGDDDLTEDESAEQQLEPLDL